MNEWISPLITQFSWAMFGTIMLANILLSGDNAIVIALAAKELPEHQRNKAIWIGSAAAIVMRVLLTLVAAKLMTLPGLKLVGGAALVYIAIGLLTDSDDESEHKPAHSMSQAIRTILVADLVMSLDNVVAVAAAAKGNTPMLILGLLTSIPLIIVGSTLLMKVMERVPAIVIAGAGLLGWLAGEMYCGDPLTVKMFGEISHSNELVVQVTCAIFVIATAWWRNGKKLQWTAGQSA